MLYNLIILCIIFILSLWPVSLAGGIFPPGIFPDLLLVLSIFWVVYFGRERKMLWILMAGFFLDLATGETIGKNIFLLAASAHIISYLSSKLLMHGELEKFFLTMAFIAAATILNEILSRTLTLFILKDDFQFNLLIGKEIWIKTFFNLAFFMLIYSPVIKLEKIFFIQKEEIKI